MNVWHIIRRYINRLRHWQKANEELTTLSGGVILYALLSGGLYFGWFRARTWWVYLLLSLPIISMLISAIKLGWIDKLLGTRLAARLWLREGYIDLRLGNQREAARCFAKARRFTPSKPPAILQEESGLLARLLCALGIARWQALRGTFLRYSGNPKAGGKALLRAQNLYQRAGKHVRELVVLGLLAGTFEHLPEPLAAGVAQRRHYLKTRLELEALGRAAEATRKALAHAKAGKLPIAKRALYRLYHNLLKSKLRHRRVEAIALATLAYLGERLDDPRAQDWATSAAGKLSEILNLEKALFQPGLTLDADLLDVATFPVRATAESLEKLAPEVAWIVWLLLAMCYVDERKLDAAHAHCQKAIACVERARVTRTNDERRVQFMTRDKMVAFDFMLQLLVRGTEASQTAVAERRARQAFDYVERAKARALLDLLQLGDLSKGEQAKLCTAQDIQQTLPPGSALVEYYLSDNLLLIFILTSDRFDLISQLSKPSIEGLIKSVNRFEQGMGSMSNLVNESAKELYECLLKPLESVWLEASGVEHLFIVPHGELHQLPFCALFDGKSFLTEKVAITQVPSAGVLNYLWNTRSDQPRIQETFFGVANPRGDAERYPSWSGFEDIVGCETSIEYGAQSFAPSACLLKREKATYTRFLQHLPQYTIIDLETHAEHDLGLPMRSFFLLTGEDGEPRKVTVTEIMRDVRFHPRLQLLILAVCYGSKVKVTPGNDLLGLIHGFMIAGARSILAYRWPLIDEPEDEPAGAELLKLFYQSLVPNGQITEYKDKALQSAQIALIKRGRNGERPERPKGGPTWDHPYYWAWTLIGDHLSGGG